jgi:hypothetical protein
VTSAQRKGQVKAFISFFERELLSEALYMDEVARGNLSARARETHITQAMGQAKMCVWREAGQGVCREVGGSVCEGQRG